MFAPFADLESKTGKKRTGNHPLRRKSGVKGVSLFEEFNNRVPNTHNYL